METSPNSRTAIVVDDRPLMRDLLRLALEELGFVTASEEPAGRAAIEAAAEHRPDVLILDEGAVAALPEMIERIRSASPDSTVVILTTDRSATPPALAAAADAVVEEGAGLRDLPRAVRAGPAPPARDRGRRRSPRPARKPTRGERWLKRVQGAVAASILLLGVLIVLPASGVDGRLAAAQDSLVLLVEELPDASPEEAVSLATTLISQRAMLLSRHVDVGALDAEIAARLDPLLPSLPADVALGLTGVLGHVLPIGASPAATPAPTPPPEPSGPTGAPSPDPQETGSPTPDHTVPPTPSEPPTPDPTRSPSPDPSGSPSPSTASPPPDEIASPIPGASS